MWGKGQKSLLFIIFFFIFALSTSGVISATDLSDVETLEAFLDGIISSQFNEHNIPGATLSVVKDGEIIISKGYGFSDLEERPPVDPDRTLFRPGSVSKLFTWTAVMQLVERGELDLEADINQYLDFDIPAELNNGDGGEPAPITLEHLMTHTPGFEDRGEGLFELGEENLKTLEEYLRDYLPARVFPPGEVMAYSNYGTALAGYIVERVSGQPFEEYVEENIFGPLEMENSTFRQPLPENLAPDMARAYKYHGGRFHQGEFEFISGSPAGALSTTATDMARFMIAHLQEGTYGEAEILSPETTRQMHSQQFTHHEQIPGMTYGFIEEGNFGETVIGHGGSTFLFFSGLFLVPEQDLGLFISYSGGTPMEAGKLFKAFMERYFPKELASLPEPDSDAMERAMAYQGEYHPNRSNFSSFEKVLGIFQRVNVRSDEDGYLLGTFFGETSRFAEVEPGLYQNLKQEGHSLVGKIGFTTGPGGETMLISGGPVTFSMVPWYGSSLLLGGLSALALLLILGALLGWPFGAIGRKIRGEYYPTTSVGVVGRLVGAAFGIFTLIMVIGFVALFGNVDPAFGVPEIMFGEAPAVLDLLLYIPVVLAVLAVAMFVFFVLSWWQDYWSVGTRIYYGLFTISAFGFLWVLYYAQFFSQLF